MTPIDRAIEALGQASGMLIRHHQWHVQQTTPDPEHGFIPADEYADSSLYEQTAGAIEKIDEALSALKAETPEGEATYPKSHAAAESAARQAKGLADQAAYVADHVDTANNALRLLIDQAGPFEAWRDRCDAYERRDDLANDITSALFPYYSKRSEHAEQFITSLLAAYEVDKERRP